MANNASISNISVDLTELSADTSPQLGGNLDLNSNNITGTGNINTTGTITSSGAITSSGTVTGNTFSGSGASLTNLPSAQLTGALPAIDGSNLTGINTDLVADTTPQLGGNLDLNSNNITGTGDVDITGDIKGDDIVLKNGVSSNLTFETPNNTYGYYRIKSNTSDATGNYGLLIEDGVTNNDLAKFWSGSSSTSGSFLYHNGTERLHANNVGVDITGNLTTTGTITPGTYRAGEIIEELNAQADGRTVSLLSGNYTMQNVTATQNGSTTWTAVTGSTMSYTPPAGTNYVYFRFYYHWDVTENSGISGHKIQIDGTDINPSHHSISSNYASTNWHHAGFPVSIEYCIDLTNSSDDIANGKLNGWSSAKTLRVMYREHSSSYESRLHYNSWEYASDTQHLIKPHMTIRAIA